MLADNLPKALAIYADVLRRPHLPEDQLEAGRLAMLQELRAVEDEPAQKVMMELRRRHYGEPWGRSAQGRQEALETTTIDDVRGYFRRRYRPNGTILGVAGRIEFERLKDLVGELLGDWSPGDDGALDETTSRAHYRHVPYDSHQTQIGIAYSSVPYRHPDYFQAFGAVGVLSGGMSARLFTEVRERRGLCYSVYATLHTFLHRGAVFCYAGTSAERAQETLDVTLAELTRLARGIEESELDRLKARIKSALIMQQESSSAPQFVAGPRLVSPGPRPHAGGSRPLDRRPEQPQHQRLPGRASAGRFHGGHAGFARAGRVPGGRPSLEP